MTMEMREIFTQMWPCGTGWLLGGFVIALGRQTDELGKTMKNWIFAEVAVEVIHEKVLKL